jgi:hypothetical protein
MSTTVLAVIGVALLVVYLMRRRSRLASMDED